MTLKAALRDRTIQRVKDGLTIEQLAYEFDVEIPCMKARLKKWHLVPRKPIRENGSAQSKADTSRQEVRALAARGFTRHEIAEQLGLTPGYVGVLARQDHIQIARKLPPDQKIHRNRDLISMYLENHTLQEVGDRFGLTRERVRQLLHKYGIQPRDYTGFTVPRPPRRTQTFSERFWANVDKTPGQGPTGECWEWKGGSWVSGYGYFCSFGKRRYAHRLAYLLHHRRAIRQWCLHHCDNRKCVRPDHLYDGTPLQNAQDRLFKKTFANVPNAVPYRRAIRHQEGGAKKISQHA